MFILLILNHAKQRFLLIHIILLYVAVAQKKVKQAFIWSDIHLLSVEALRSFI